MQRASQETNRAPLSVADQFNLTMRLGHISKMGNGYLRRLLVVGATSVTRRAETTDTRTGAWVRSLLGRKPTRLVTVAIANKTARTAWAMLVRQEDYRASAMA